MANAMTIKKIAPSRLCKVRAASSLTRAGSLSSYIYMKEVGNRLLVTHKHVFGPAGLSYLRPRRAERVTLTLPPLRLLPTSSFPP